MNTILKATLWMIFLLQCSASSANSIDNFLTRISVKTYDCPDDEFIPQVDNYLRDPQATGAQLIDLKVHKAHWLICVGKNDIAKETLDALLEDPLIDKGSQSYASAHYQIGFIHDVNDEPERCEFYRKSEQLSKDRFDDIYLSSQLGLITVCDQEKQSIGVKLGRMFSLVKIFSLKGDQQALAHVHNNIGLLYGSIGQRGLAAEQYEKSYRLGLEVYEEKNQLAPLISVISAYTGSGDYENARLMIEELRKGNLKVNTPLTNSWYHFAQSRYYYLTRDFESMRRSLRSWEVFLAKISNRQMELLFDWHTAALCLYDGNRTCVKDFLQSRSDTNDKLAKQKHYLAFLVKAHLFLGNVEAADARFEKYTAVVDTSFRDQQNSAKVLGVANLHNEILSLEADLVQANQQRIQAMLAILVVVLLLGGTAYFTVGRNYLKKLATDPLTGICNEQSALSKIRRVKVPLDDNVNALAVFDVANFTEVNEQFGHMAGDLALKHVAMSLKRVTREKDIVGRLGANQFIVCLMNLSESTASELFGRIQKALENVAFDSAKGESVNVRSSMTMYSSLTDFSDLDEVLNDMKDALGKHSLVG